MSGETETLSVGTFSSNHEENDSELLSAGELDVRYLKLLRLHGEEKAAEYYGMRRRFCDQEYEAVPFEGTSMITTVDLSDSIESEIEQEAEPDYSSGVTSRDTKTPGVKLGSASRKVLQPEVFERNQPLKMKGARKSADAGVPGGKTELLTTYDAFGAAKREAEVERTIKDFSFNFVFLIVTNIVMFGVQDHAYNYYTQVLSDIVTNSEFETEIGIRKTFNEIRSIDEIWDFIRGVLIDVLFRYGDDHTRSIHKDEEHEVLILFQHLLIGVPRIRQLRVRNDSCKLGLFFTDMISTCYYYYSDGLQDKSPFGSKISNSWIYTEPDMNSASYAGKISTYGGGGYMMNITRDEEYTLNWIAELIRNDWITEGTRAVFIDFTTYSPNTNLFCVVKLVFEIPPTGGVIPTSHFDKAKFFRYVNICDHIVFACAIMWICFFVYFAMDEIERMIALKEEYWYSTWDILNATVVIASFAYFISAIISIYSAAKGMAETFSHIDTGTHASFDRYMELYDRFQTSSQIVAFLMWVKVLKFAALNKSVALILSIFEKVKFELASLTLMMFTMVVGFSLLGNLLFGTYVEQFDTIWNSCFSLVSTFVGGLYFYLNCSRARPVLAPIFFVLFIFIVLVLFLSAYVAVLVHGFLKATEAFEEQRDRVFLGDIWQLLLYKTLKLFRKNNLAIKLKNTNIAKGNKKDYEDLLRIVKKHGFRGLDLTMFLKRYNVTPGAPVPFERMSLLYNELDPKNQLALEFDEHDKIMVQVDSIVGKVGKVSKSVEDLAVKVDILVNRLLYTDGKA